MPSPEHDAVVAMLRSAASQPPAEPMSFDLTRRSLDALGAMSPVPDTVAIEPVDIGGVACERHLPEAQPRPGDEPDVTILYLHGGAYVAGSLASHRPLCARLAVATGRPVLAVAYRLAPEHPHPAAIEDATAVHRALVAAGHRVVVVGDSAGGGLAAATLLALAADPDEGTELPVGAVLLSPWLDLTLTAGSITTVADPLLDADVLAASAAAYAGTDLADPLVSPVFASAEQLAALPPLLVLTGTADLLVDDSRTFAERARAAGAEVELDVEDGLIHVWPLFDGLPETTAALSRVDEWIRKHT